MDQHYDVVIIGAGPAGMTAAIYASRAGLKTIMLEDNVPGGKMLKTYEIENYPSVKQINGADLAMEMYAHSTEFGAEYAYGHVTKIQDGEEKRVLCEDGTSYTCSAVIIATGTKERLMGIPNEKECTGKGVSYCAVCDGALFRDKEVVIIGGGNAALEETLFLTQFVSKATIVIRRDVFRAEDNIQKRIEENPKIEILKKHIPVRIEATDGKVSGIVLQNVETKEETTLACSGIFPYIGQDPVTELVKDLGITDEKGYILVNKQMETTHPGIFACGDCIQKDLRQVITACGDGALAAQMAYHRVKG